MKAGNGKIQEERRKNRKILLFGSLAQKKPKPNKQKNETNQNEQHLGKSSLRTTTFGSDGLSSGGLKPPL